MGVTTKELVICQGGCWDAEAGTAGICGRRYVFVLLFGRWRGEGERNVEKKKESAG
jgi:hypothetical protein